MSYIYNNKFEYADSPNLDSFGRLRTAGITSLLEVKQVGDDAESVVYTTTKGGGSTSYNSGESYTSLDVSTAGVAIRQSKNSALYQPGKSQLIECSFSRFGSQSGTRKRVGYFNNLEPDPSSSTEILDGLFLESDATGSASGEQTFYIYRNGTKIWEAPLSTWDASQFDPTTIDWEKVQLLVIDFQWLGVGRVRFGMSFGGVTYIFAEYTAVNDLYVPYMRSPNQPLRWEIYGDGSGPGSLRMICGQASMEGSLNRLYTPYSLTQSFTNLSTNTRYGLLGYRVKDGLLGTSIKLSDVGILLTTNDNYLLELVRNPVTATSYTWDDRKFFEASDDIITVTALTAADVLYSSYGLQNSVALNKFNFGDSTAYPGAYIDRTSGTGDEYWICITPLSANATGKASFNWEIFR